MSNYDWTAVIQVGIISAALLLSNILRRKIPFMRRSLAPTAVIAGFLLMILRNVGALPDTVLSLEFLENLTYHGIAVGFIALALRVSRDAQEKKESRFVGVRTGALIVSTYLVQALIGLSISFVLCWTFMPDLFKGSGVLLALGFGQGPGQANNIGSTYENSFGFSGGLSFGLAIAAAGYICACLIGVVYLTVMSHKGKVRRADYDEVSGSVTVDEFQSENEIPIAQSIDRFSIQAALVLLIYLITFLALYGVEKLLGLFMEDTSSLTGILWGFNFIFAALFAFLAKGVMGLFKKANLMKRQYSNNYLLSRISGFAFDVMIIAGIASINVEDLTGLWVPFVLMVVLGAVGTFMYLYFMCKKLYPDYFYEGFVGLFGMLTGTISSGVLLIREIDPELKTPAANNLVLGTSFGIVFGVPVLIIVGKIPQSDLSAYICYGIIAAYLAALLTFIFLMGRKLKKK